MSYYLAEFEYIGPHSRKRYNAHWIDIAKTPFRTSMSREPRTTGWLGATDDVSGHALGRFKTLSQARRAAEARYPLRPTEIYDSDIVESYLVGEFEECDGKATDAYVRDILDALVTAETTNAAIEGFIDEFERVGRNDEEIQICRVTTRRIAWRIRRNAIRQRQDERAPDCRQ